MEIHKLPVCPVCESSDYIFNYTYWSFTCVKEHCGKGSICRVTNNSLNYDIIQTIEIHLIICGSLVYLKHYPNNKYTFLYDSDGKLLIYYPRLVFNDYKNLKKKKKKISTYLTFA